MRTARQLRAELRRAVLIIEAALADHDDWPCLSMKGSQLPLRRVAQKHVSFCDLVCRVFECCLT